MPEGLINFSCMTVYFQVKVRWASLFNVGTILPFCDYTWQYQRYYFCWFFFLNMLEVSWEFPELFLRELHQYLCVIRYHIIQGDHWLYLLLLCIPSVRHLEHIKLSSNAYSRSENHNSIVTASLILNEIRIRDFLTQCYNRLKG